ncbi:Xaa-Pro dipeptidase [Thermotoga maritima MSB8]|uniref:Aminopeptidase P, putative n=1 Tax=Thermotoga maritima (strain ATCC 43589 / DSM 3109 / JCM 10099 / NBRC 100826 / MSB8) TaxID=243274 RepID=Q9WXP9_THEMA|nr:Xaa-Pro peptidase family protein [Thermotoga maritima]2ZSG_A Chain A, Aminopeptidase P, putative [Thermotoga maritima]2ZSG_B Chain B, Aminopeptidase P, putative [Thermotoga maritima]AAD35136.1 aminopeptidase P, putative [Thermotoga maritima MSB8]AGL48965.1 Aminopeptidase YpdF (MP-, MA-, MS-, AP-, NP- specific) [Thermotoga maritima MSB8]AHD18187.1 peptidase M24 [Thermotoga maritima MSB8]AKE25989.1 Xaa-Pro dipeptidase [Thermotoga maritima]AKE27851.1 Xaa-Pro dipeptidase [Thermotoga maritima 
MDRSERLIQLISEEGIDAFLIMNIENSARASSVYFSGFTGSFSIILISENTRLLITDSRYTVQAKQETDFEVREVKGGDFIDVLKKTVNDLKIKTIALEEERVSLSLFRRISSAFGDRKFIGIDDEVKQMRMVKDEGEIEKIKQAIEISERAFLETVQQIRAGMTEKEIAALLEYTMRKEGAEGVAFDTIVASGCRSALPHGKASDKVVERGDVIVIDFGATYENYCADITRVVSIGEPSDEVKEVHSIVLEAQERALKIAKAGVTGKLLDSVAREFIREKGYGEFFGHSLGHGIGLEVHEGPAISFRNDSPLPENVVFTVEPGIYLEGKFGIRIEEDVVLKEQGCEILTTLPRSIFVV